MTVARVASAENIRTGTTDPHTFSYAGGTPQGIAIAIVHGISGTALATSVSYGGVPLALVVEAADTATEPGNAQIWFLGSGVPAGTQTVSIDLTSASATDIHTVVWELSGADDLQVIDSDLINDNVANPTVTLQANGRNKISLCAMYGGGAAPGGTLAAGNTLDHTHDLGAFYSQTCYETSVSSSDHTIGWSSLGTDDVALVAVAVAEAVAVQPLTGTLFTKAPTFNAGAVTAISTLSGVLFAKAPTFSVGTVIRGAVALTGTLFTETPNFPTGAVSIGSTLAGTLFVKAPTFPTGAAWTYTNPVVVELTDQAAPDTDLEHSLRAHARTAAGAGFIRVRLFQNTTLIAGFEFAPTGIFATYTDDLAEAEAATITDYNDLQIHIDLRATTTPFTPEIDWVDLLRPVAAGVTLNGQVFQTAPVFNVGAITAQRTITGNLFTTAPFFQQGVLDVQPNPPQVLSGVVFVKAPTFGVGAITVGPVTVTGTLLTVVPAFPSGTVNSSVTLTGILLASVPTFLTGTVVGEQSLVGVVFEKAPTFFAGNVGLEGSLDGVLFANAPVFFQGTLTVAPLVGSFWTPDPAGYTVNLAAYTVNPAAFVRVGRGDVPPWPIEIDGEEFELAPTFFAGAVT